MTDYKRPIEDYLDDVPRMRKGEMPEWQPDPADPKPVKKPADETPRKSALDDYLNDIPRMYK